MSAVVALCFFSGQTAFTQGIGVQMTDKNAKPVNQPPPNFPAGAKQSGFCDARFDVNTEGTPENITIYKCSDNLYEWPSEVSVKKFEYEPKIVGGSAVWRRGVETRLVYQLKSEFGIRIPEPEAVDTAVTPDDLATVLSLDLTKKARKARTKDNTYCCYTYSVSQTGSPFNVVAEKCSNEDTLEIFGSGYDIRQWRFQPALKGGERISSRGYKDVVWFVRNGQKVYRGTPEDVTQYCPAP